MNEIARALVRKTIQYTETLIAQGAVSWDSAKMGIEMIADDLSREYPECAYWIRQELEGWLSQHRGRGDGSAREGAKLMTQSRRPPRH